MQLVQWNVWNNEAAANILAALRDMKPDIICLQELTIDRAPYNPGIDVPRFIAEGLGFHYVFADAQKGIIDSAEQAYGNGIFSRYPITGSAFHYIQEPPAPGSAPSDYSKEARAYLEAAIEAEGKKLTVATTHMSYTDRLISTPAKEAETDALVEILKAKKSDFIFTGDLNALPDSYTINEISKHLKDVGPISSNTWTTKPFSYQGFEANTLDWRLDYCFATPDVRVTSSRVVDTAYSDHLPILIEF